MVAEFAEEFAWGSIRGFIVNKRYGFMSNIHLQPKKFEEAISMSWIQPKALITLVLLSLNVLSSRFHID